MEAKPIPEGKFDLILADPPWRYSNAGFNQSASKHYPTMSVKEICELPIENVTLDSSVLFLWATAPLLPEALQVMKAWGFTYKTHLVWVKNRAPGIGWWVQTKHELLLIGVRKKSPKPKVKPISVFEGKSFRHSQKPEESYRIIEEMYPQAKKLELFARQKREGWTVWGNEV